MKRAVCLAALLVVVSLVSGATEARRQAAKVMGRTLYWTTEGVAFDTLDWHRMTALALEQTVDTLATPATTAALFESAGKKLLRLKGPSAVSVAILRQLGYPVFVLDQWSGEVDGYVQLAHERDYNAQRLRTDLLWEPVSAASIEDAGGPVARRSVKLTYGAAGYCRYAFDAVLTAGSELNQGVPDDVELDFASQQVRVRVLLRRRIFSVCMVAGAKKKPSTIVSEIEKEMDALKLDLSYKPPEIVEVK